MTDLVPCSICGRKREVDPEAASKRLQWCTQCSTKVRRGTERERRMDARYLRAFWRALFKARPGKWLTGSLGQLIHYPEKETTDADSP